MSVTTFPRLVVAFTLAFLVGLCLVVPLVLTAAPADTSTPLLKARIAQLEALNSQLRAQVDLCRVQTEIPNIEREANCTIDWSATPPVCKPAPAKPAPAK